MDLPSICLQHFSFTSTAVPYIIGGPKISKVRLMTKAAPTFDTILYSRISTPRTLCACKISSSYLNWFGNFSGSLNLITRSRDLGYAHFFLTIFVFFLV